MLKISWITYLIILLQFNLYATDEHARFIKAIQLGKTARVDSFLQQGMATDQLSQIGATPLIYAIWGSHSDIIDLLISYGANANMETDRFGNPLSIATQVGNMAICKKLILSGAAIESYSKDGKTMLMEAIYNQHPLIAHLYVKSGANVNAVGPNGSTALMYASMIGDTTSVRFLLAAGADPNIATESGETPLGKAGEFGYTKIIEMLRGAGAKIPSSAD